MLFLCFSILFIAFQVFSNGFEVFHEMYLGFLRFVWKVDTNTKDDLLGAGCPSRWSGQTLHLRLTDRGPLWPRSGPWIKGRSHSDILIRVFNSGAWASLGHFPEPWNLIICLIYWSLLKGGTFSYILTSIFPNYHLEKRLGARDVIP